MKATRSLVAFFAVLLLAAFNASCTPTEEEWMAKGCRACASENETCRCPTTAVCVVVERDCQRCRRVFCRPAAPSNPVNPAGSVLPSSISAAVGGGGGFSTETVVVQSVCGTASSTIVAVVNSTSVAARIVPVGERVTSLAPTTLIATQVATVLRSVAATSVIRITATVPTVTASSCVTQTLVESIFSTPILVNTLFTTTAETSVQPTTLSSTVASCNFVTQTSACLVTSTVFPNVPTNAAVEASAKWLREEAEKRKKKRV